MTRKKSEDVFEKKKEIIKLQSDLLDKRHKLEMEELEYKRESDRIHFEREKECMRIKNADIKRTVMLKQQQRY